MDEDDRLQEVVGEGSDAYAAGEPWADCPYPADSVEAEAWLVGWCEEHDHRAGC